MQSLAHHWQLDPEITFLNHGSFGACPRGVLAHQSALRSQLESEPLRFFMREFEPLLDAARAELASFLNTPPTDLVFVPNATAGVNSVLRSLRFEPGDELLTTDHVYNACRNAMEFVAAQQQAKVVLAPVPFPIDNPGQVVDAVLSRVTARTRLVLLDHITSPTGLILPIEEILPELQRRGIDTLVDGAHAPGMVPLDLAALGATYYTGNCHKWLCAPKGAAFLCVQPDRQAGIRPLSISHGANSKRTDRSRFHLEFDWPGTDDPTAWLCVGEALTTMESLFPDGWEGLRRHNRELALGGRALLCEALEIPSPAPESMIGSLATVPLALTADSGIPMGIHPLQDRLFFDHRIEVPVWPMQSLTILRISGAAYNHLAQYEALAEALPGCLQAL